MRLQQEAYLSRMCFSALGLVSLGERCGGEHPEKMRIGADTGVACLSQETENCWVECGRKHGPDSLELAVGMSPASTSRTMRGKKTTSSHLVCGILLHCSRS